MACMPPLEIDAGEVPRSDGSFGVNTEYFIEMVDRS